MTAHSIVMLVQQPLPDIFFQVDWPELADLIYPPELRRR